MRTSPLFRVAVLLAMLSPAAYALTPEALFEKLSPSILVVHSVDQQSESYSLR